MHSGHCLNIVSCYSLDKFEVCKWANSNESSSLQWAKSRTWFALAMRLDAVIASSLFYIKRYRKWLRKRGGNYVRIGNLEKRQSAVTHLVTALFSFKPCTQTRARTGMGCPTGVWDQRVYRFRHLGLSGCKVTNNLRNTSMNLEFFLKICIFLAFSCFIGIIFVLSQRDFKSIRDITWKSAIRITALSLLAAWVEGCGL